MTKADKTVAFRPSVEIWEKLQQESNYSVAIEAALKQYYGIVGATPVVTPQSPITPLMERLGRLEEHCILDEGKVKEVALQARTRACRNEDAIINLDDRIFALKEFNKKSIIAFQSSQANFHAEIANLSAKIDTLENMPSHKPQQEAIEANQVVEDLPVEIDPVMGIDVESEAGRGIQATELKDILGIPQSTLSDWGKRRERGEGKPKQTPQDKWDEFMSWEKRDRRWYK